MMHSIKVDKTQYKISDFLSWYRSSDLVLSPEFQRNSVWKKAQKAYLIDTVLRGFPVPIIYIRDRVANLETLKQEREVVDGQQRLRTILAFVLGADFGGDYDLERDDFTISKTYTPELKGMRFNDLEDQEKSAILTYEFSTHVLPSDTSDSEVLQIFSRMNSTGTKLNEQELRNAEFFGPFKVSAYNSAYKYIGEWRNRWGVFSADNIARMKEVELISDIYGMMLCGVQGKTNKYLTGLYRDYDEVFEERSVVEERLEALFDLISKNFENIVKDSRFKNPNLFFLLCMVLYDDVFGVDEELVRRKPSKISKKLLDWVRQVSEWSDLDFKDLVMTQRAASKDSRENFLEAYRNEKKG